MWSVLFLLIFGCLVGGFLLHSWNPVSETPSQQAVRSNGQQYHFPADFFTDHQPLASKMWVQSELQDILSVVHELLSEKRLVWYATHSTLLGALLVGGILPWEDKLEFSVEFTPDQLRALVQLRPEFLVRGFALTRSPRGYCVHKTTWQQFPRAELRWEIRRGENYTACGPLTELNECPLQRAGRVVTPAEELFPLATLRFENVQIPVPRETERCVVRQLGPRALTRAPTLTSSARHNAWLNRFTPLVFQH